MMTPARKRLMNLVASEPLGVSECAVRLGVPLNAASDVRNNLVACGWVERQEQYDDPIILSDAGRRALASNGQLEDRK